MHVHRAADRLRNLLKTPAPRTGCREGGVRLGRVDQVGIDFPQLSLAEAEVVERTGPLAAQQGVRAELAHPTARPHPVAHEQVSAAIAELIGQFPMPAVVVNRYQDVLAANPIARALCPGFEVGQNLSRWRFLDPAAKQVYPEWDEANALAVRGLRQGSADDPDNPRLLGLISELLSGSERFKKLWEQADVGYPKGISHMRHAEVGDLYLTRTQLDLAQSPGQYIITLHAPANSASTRALHQLRVSLQNNPVSDL